jgi:hypothetical protein
MKMNILKRTLLLTVMLVTVQAYAQPYKTIRPYKPYKWMFGIHWSAIEDDGNKFGGMFDVNQSWNLKPYPTMLTIDRYFLYGWSAELSANYGQYSGNRLVNDSLNVTGINFSADLNAKYSFYNLYAPNARWIEPYIVAGAGFTYRTGSDADQNVITANLGGGLNLWFADWIGIRLSSTAKFGVFPGFWDTPNNYLMYNAGIVFRTPDQSTNSYSNKKRHKWTNKRSRKYKKKGGQ